METRFWKLFEGTWAVARIYLKNNLNELEEQGPIQAFEFTD
jgi:hypothetical protein